MATTKCIPTRTGHWVMMQTTPQSTVFLLAQGMGKSEFLNGKDYDAKEKKGNSPDLEDSYKIDPNDTNSNYRTIPKTTQPDPPKPKLTRPNPIQSEPLV